MNEDFIKKLTHDDFLRFKKQDRMAFEMIFKMYSKDIYNFLLLKTYFNYDIAEDLLNDTFLTAYEAAPKLSSNKNIQSWLLKIAYRKFLDYRRKLTRDEKYMKIIQQDVTNQKEIYDEIEEKQKRLLLDMSLKTLSPEYRRIIQLKYEDKKTIKEIAGILNKTEGAIINILARAKTKLKKEIRKYSKGFVEG